MTVSVTNAIVHHDQRLSFLDISFVALVVALTIVDTLHFVDFLSTSTTHNESTVPLCSAFLLYIRLSDDAALGSVGF